MINLEERNTTVLRILIGLLILVPPLGVAYLILRYSVDVPQWDEWGAVRSFELWSQGDLSLSRLFTQENEYRQFFPNLLFVGMGVLTRWDLRYEMWASFVVACIVFCELAYLSNKCLRWNTTQKLLLLAAVSLCLFSPVQFENWLQGQQLIYFVPVLCLTTGFVVAVSERVPIVLRFSLGAVLAAIATLSSVNGFLCWLLLPPVLLDGFPARAGKRKWALILWGVASVLTIAIYLHNYAYPANTPGVVLTRPGQAFLYFVSVLGSPFAFGSLPLAIVIGIIMLALYVWCCRTFFFADSKERSASVLWILLGAYSVATAAMISAGRVQWGLQQSLTRRYTTFTIFLAIALILLLPSAIRRTLGNRQVAARAPLALSVLIVSLLVNAPIYWFSFSLAREFRVALLQGKACLLFVNQLPDKCFTPVLHPDSQRLPIAANKLNRLGYLRPPLIKSKRLLEIEAPVAAPAAYGAFSELKMIGANEFEASGDVFLPHRGEPADAVLLAFEHPNDGPTVFAIALPELEPTFLQRLRHRSVDNKPHWRKTFSALMLPAGTDQITAWAFDAESGKAYRLTGAHFLPATARAPVTKDAR